MEQAKTSIQGADQWEFTRIDANLIKVDAADIWREINLGNLESLKASIAWREKRMKGSGLLIPLLVTKMDGVPYYKLEDGFRRLSAIQSLMMEGMTFENVPVRILPVSLSMSEKLMLAIHSSQPPTPLEEGRILARLEKQGLSLDRLAILTNRSVELLRKRVLLVKLTGSLARALADKTISAEDIEKQLNTTEPLLLQQQKLEKSMGKFLDKHPGAMPSKKPLGPTLGRKGMGNNKSATSWMPKALDPMFYYVSIDGLYEWMGGTRAASHGYSPAVVETVRLLLKYCGGGMNLQETAEKLKKL
jgi:hypothetical protein